MRELDIRQVMLTTKAEWGDVVDAGPPWSGTDLAGTELTLGDAAVLVALNEVGQQDLLVAQPQLVGMAGVGIG